MYIPEPAAMPLALPPPPPAVIPLVVAFKSSSARTNSEEVVRCSCPWFISVKWTSRAIAFRHLNSPPPYNSLSEYFQKLNLTS
jgi:hypothetical protein